MILLLLLLLMMMTMIMMMVMMMIVVVWMMIYCDGKGLGISGLMKGGWSLGKHLDPILISSQKSQEISFTCLCIILISGNEKLREYDFDLSWTFRNKFSLYHCHCWVWEKIWISFWSQLKIHKITNFHCWVRENIWISFWSQLKSHFQHLHLTAEVGERNPDPQNPKSKQFNLLWISPLTIILLLPFSRCEMLQNIQSSSWILFCLNFQKY